MAFYLVKIYLDWNQQRMNKSKELDFFLKLPLFCVNIFVDCAVAPLRGLVFPPFFVSVAQPRLNAATACLFACLSAFNNCQ